MKVIKNKHVRLYRADCLKALKKLPDNFVHSVVTDPPYGLGSEPDALEMLSDWISTGHHEVKSKGGFMGKAWDNFVPQPYLWKEVFRVLKPGGHVVCFAGTRTYDLMVLGLRLAGFEIRDQIAWVYGQGFPKSQNIGKAIDKKVGVKSKVVGKSKTNVGMKGGKFAAGSLRGEIDKTEVTSIEGKPWDGWGTALKPAVEPIVLARKPLEHRPLSANILKHRTGGINIKGCRVGSEKRVNQPAGNNAGTSTYIMGVKGMPKDAPHTNAEGRWPANLIHDGSEDAVNAFPSSSIPKTYVRGKDGHNKEVYGKGMGQSAGTTSINFGDSGSNARFFYCAKSSKKDREEGLQFFEAKEIAGKGNGLGRTCASCGASVLDGCECLDRTFVNPSRKNHHPTVKPTELMRYLVRLVTPPKGIVLDPYMGSGTTGKAAMIEGFRFVGIEREKDYFPICVARIRHAVEKHNKKEKQKVLKEHLTNHKSLFEKSVK